MVNYIATNINTEKYTVYSDIPGMEAPGGGTLPPNICITNLKPDIVIVDEEAKEVHIYELTCPSGPANIEKRHLEKTQKYSTFLTDCTGYNSFVVCFEVSSKGFLTTRNHSHLNSLHRFLKPSLKRSTFKENVSALTVYGSYQIWLSRAEAVFVVPPFLVPHTRGQKGGARQRQGTRGAGQ